jgi:hypothetical protein
MRNQKRHLILSDLIEFYIQNVSESFENSGIGRLQHRMLILILTNILLLASREIKVETSEDGGL